MWFILREIACSSVTDTTTLADYAGIIVVRHGETAWNAVARIQVSSTFFTLCLYFTENVIVL